MSVTIDSLDIQITTSAGGAASKIDELADALGRLKANAGLTKVTNNLNKLAAALDAVNNVNVNSNKLQALTTALNGLSGIQRLTGLNSAMNALKKLPGVIDGLDAADLAKFTKQMEKLAKALEPVARKIDKVASGFARLPAHIRNATGAMGSMSGSVGGMGGAIDSANLNLFTMIGNMESVINFANQVINTISGMMSQAIEWDGIQFRFGRAFGEDAEEVYQYVLKINEVLGINTQEFMQYSSLYGSLLKGFGVAQQKVTAISVGLTELSYDIWAAYNDRFKSLEDASEAVRSAITGEIEPIRNAGIALTEASLQEYIDSTHLAGVSIEKLTEAQKAEVRYAAMVDAALSQGIVGTYAREMQTAEGAVRSLTQSFKTLTQAFGSLFIPVLQIVVPYLTVFVELLTDAVFWVAALFGIDIQKIDWGSSIGGAASGLEDAAENADATTSGLKKAGDAAKKLKDYTMGFDELNVISPPDDKAASGGSGGGSGSGGSGWGSGLDLDNLWDDSVFAQASKRVDELKAKVLGFLTEWKEELAIIAASLGVLGIAKMLSHLGEALHLGDAFLGVLKNIQKFAATAIVIVLQYSLMSEFLSKFIDGEGFKNYVAAMFVGAIGTGILYSMWGPAGLVIGLGVTAAASLKAVIDNGGITNVESVVTALTGLATAAGAVYGAFKLLSKSNVGAFFALLKEGEPFVGTLAAAFPKLANAISKFGGWISTAASAVGSFVAGISAPVWATIAAVIAAIASSAYFLYKNWKEVTKVAKEFFKQNIAPKLEKIGEHFSDMKTAIQPLIDTFKEVKASVEEFFEGIDWSWLSVIGKLFEGLGGVIFGTVSGVIATAFNILVGIIENVIQVFSGVVQVVSGVVEFIVALFSGDDIGPAWKKIWNGVVDVIMAIPETVVGFVKDLYNGVVDWFKELYDELVGHSIVPDMIDAIVDWFLSLPKKILKPVQDFINNIILKFKNMWTDIKSWFKENVAPKFTKEYWSGKFNAIVLGATAKLAEVKNTIAERWGLIKTWYNSNVAPKFTKDYWAKTFDAIRTGLKEKLDAAWEAVKKFFSVEEWKKKVTGAMQAIRDNFKIPSLPSIHLEVTWDTNVGSIKRAVYEALGLPGWPRLKWSAYAMGGFPSMGEMFIARESGPELVGSIGNRSAVVNNDQIVEAVSRGVYNAVTAAMANSTGSEAQPVNVYLDGKQIYSSFKKIEGQRGLTLMGNQLGYNY